MGVSTEIARYADVAMFKAQPMERDEEYGVLPRVTLVSATPMPLRTMCAATDLYKGQITRSPLEVPQADALASLEMMSATALKAGLEFIDFHFLFEGVTRAFTHQLVRQRTAVYIQESMRFAVKEDAAVEISLPPSLQGLKEDDPRIVIWKNEVRRNGEAYNMLVNAGVPAEDARGLLPTNITTRIHYKTNLRGLMEHAGLRLCTQAQFEWRQVWVGIVQAIKGYETLGATMAKPWPSDSWEFQAISKLFAPICYRTGKCEFLADIDRHCSIRDRVQAHHSKGESSKTWVDISPREWLLDPTSARR